MTNLRQAAKQALEALEAIKWKGQPSFVEDAIAALRAALNLPEPRNQCGETCERAKLCAICAQGINLPEQEPVAWLYTLEYGTEIADRQVFLDQRRYPFGVCGADYLQANADGTSYVRETPLYTAPIPPTVPKGYALVSIDALKAWNKYDEVLAACQYSIKE